MSPCGIPTLLAFSLVPRVPETDHFCGQCLQNCDWSILQRFWMNLKSLSDNFTRRCRMNSKLSLDNFTRRRIQNRYHGMCSLPFKTLDSFIKNIWIKITVRACCHSRLFYQKHLDQKHGTCLLPFKTLDSFIKNIWIKITVRARCHSRH